MEYSKEDQNEAEKEKLIEQNEDALETWWAENDAEGVLDDDMPDAFSDWLVDTDLATLKNILKYFYEIQTKKHYRE